MSYRIEGPAVISFSGGRTSAFMLRQILDAHGGALPADVHVAFANTGKEREETLRFVHECGVRWGVPIAWLEWRAEPARAERVAALAAWLAAHDPERRMVHPDGFERVGYNSASRVGEPFAALIAMKQRLPNWQERWCTEFLKVRVLTAFATSLGLVEGGYAEVIGLRADEGHRILKARANALYRWDRKLKEQVPRVPPRRVLFPLSAAGVESPDVLRYWLGPTGRMGAGDLPQGFDLGLEGYEGNCDWCFMKGRGLRMRIARERPAVPVWWHEREVERGHWFDRRDTARDLIAECARFADLFDAPGLAGLAAELADEEHDAECGLHCAPMEAADAD